MLRPISRRTFGKLAGSGLVAGAALGGFGRAARAADTITVLNWQGYGTDEAWAVKAFADKTGITVKHDYFNSEPEMVTKLRTNPGVYDVVLVNSARIQQVAGESLVDAVDLSKVANAKDLPATLKDHPNLHMNGKGYGIPWVWGMNSLGVRQGKVANPDSFALLGDPAYADRVALFDDSTTEVAVGALLTGQDINNPKDLKAIADKLKSFKKNVKLLWSSEDEWNKAFSAGAFDVSIYWSGAAVRSQKRLHLPVDFVVPKEGAIGWLDSLAVPATSTHKESAYAFINYMIDPGFYVEWATKAGAPASANSAAMAALPGDDLTKQLYKPEYLSKLQFMAAMPDDRRTQFADLWQEVKAFYAK